MPLQRPSWSWNVSLTKGVCCPPCAGSAGRFVFDVVSSVLASVDIFLLAAGQSSALQSLRAMRVIKLVRLGRVKGAMNRLLSQSNMDLSILELLKFLMATLFMSHWLACLWGFAGTRFSDNAPTPIEEWFIENRHELSWVQKHQLTSASPLELYVVAL